MRNAVLVLGAPALRSASERPNHAGHSDHGDDSQRDNTIYAVDFEDVFLDAGEIERKRQGQNSQNRQDCSPPSQRQAGEHEVAGDADCRYWNVLDFREWTVVDDAAIPRFVDGTGLAAGGIVNAQRQG